MKAERDTNKLTQIIEIVDEDHLTEDRKFKLKKARDEFDSRMKLQFKKRHENDQEHGMWAPLEKDRAKELRDQVTTMRRDKNHLAHKHHGHETPNLDNIKKNFDKNFERFQQTQYEMENVRQESQQLLCEMSVLSDYLAAPKEIERQIEQKEYKGEDMYLSLGDKINRTKAEFEKLRGTQNRDTHHDKCLTGTALNAKIEDIKVFSEIEGRVPAEEWELAAQNHNDKMKQKQSLKPY